MEIGDHWNEIQKIFDDAYKSCFHFAVATVKPDGSPHVTPIGGLFLRDDKTGFYFEEFPSRLPENLKQNPRVCVLAINADKLLWGRALMDGKFPSPPGVRHSAISSTCSPPMPPTTSRQPGSTRLPGPRPSQTPRR